MLKAGLAVVRLWRIGFLESLRMLSRWSTVPSSWMRRSGQIYLCDAVIAITATVNGDVNRSPDRYIRGKTVASRDGSTIISARISLKPANNWMRRNGC